MSKKIDDAIRDWTKALRKHARVATAGSKSVKKTQRTAAQVAGAASAYAEAIHATSGMESPFAEVLSPGLPLVTLECLAAERD